MRAKATSSQLPLLIVHEDLKHIIKYYTHIALALADDHALL